MKRGQDHRDWALRFAGLATGRWGGILVSVTVIIVWLKVVHLFAGVFWNTLTAVYIAGLPGIAVMLLAEAGIDVSIRAQALARWRRGKDRFPPGASDAGLLGVVTIDPSGVIVTTGGALVRIVQLEPRSVAALVGRDGEQVSDGLAGLVRRLPAGQTLQIYVQSRPINTEDVLAASGTQLKRRARLVPSPFGPEPDAVRRDRRLLESALEEPLRLHRHREGDVQYDVYLVVPYVSDARVTAPGSWQQLRRSKKRPAQNPVERDREAHRRVMRHADAHVHSLCAALESLGLPNRLLDGAEAVELLYNRFNPTLPDRGAQPWAADVLSDLEASCSPAEAHACARRVQERIACSPLDFVSHPDHSLIDRDLEQVIYTASTAASTHIGRLLEAMMTCDEPFTLSAYVHSIDRRRHRRRITHFYRRPSAGYLQSEPKRRVPQLDRFQGHENQRTRGDVSSDERTGIYRLSIYQAMRERGPQPDPERLKAAVENAAEHLSRAVDCRVNRGRYQQVELWQSTLPLGRDIADRTRRYVTRNVADTLPLFGVPVGSQTRPRRRLGGDRSGGY
jgi:hypothetical protein